MNEQKIKKNDIVEIDIRRVWQALWKKVWLVGLVSILCSVTALLGTIYLITPKYESSAMFYVNNDSISMDDVSLNISSINASKSLVETYIVILNSRTCLNDVIDYAELDYDVDELRSMVVASSVNETEIFEVIVTGTDPEETADIANAIAYILPKKISNIVKGTEANVVDYAIVATSPSSPSRLVNTLVGFLIGFVLTIGIIVLRVLFDNTIRNEEDVSQNADHPILATVPDMAARSKGAYYYDGDTKKKKKKKPDAADHSANAKSGANEAILVGDGISFAATEAYKLLRTKIQFSFADNQKCRIIGVSSAFAGEGKSLSSTNLAYSLSQLDKRVLLIDCDMRRPSLASKLGIQKIPGLSNYLAGRIAIEEVIQTCGPKFGTGSFNVIAAGRNPPNPIELLSSEKMEEALNVLQESYDYIILDLPPVGEVSDGMAVAKHTDGILLVVRQDYCTRGAMMNAINQFEFVNARILGIVMNCVTEQGKGYGYGKKYGKKYYGYGQSSK